MSFKNKTLSMTILAVAYIGYMSSTAAMAQDRQSFPVIVGQTGPFQVLPVKPAKQGYDSAIVGPNGKAYFFSKDSYMRYNQYKDHVDFSNPFPNEHWPGVPANTDAAFTHPRNKKVYFFKGDKYYRFEFLEKGKVENGANGTPISTGWKGVPNNIDAALPHPLNDSIYFFKGQQYYKFSLSQDKVVKTGRIGIDGWAGIPSNVDYAFMNTNGKAYFFKGGNYHRFNFATEKTDKNGTISRGWPGVKYTSAASTNNAAREKDKIYNKNTSPPAESLHLKVTLTAIKAVLTEDSDDIGDYQIFQHVGYKTSAGEKNVQQRRYEY